ncbi:probable tRNA (uracil-O(2)-)-methyltransferase [Orussus abietinus]|uniref:probable tRNA (uracil-O(2)-)-methyltransferase n=1 Tax=Orussus abietinus TaxID=222816 RepID=UPI000625C9EB|nr:probable tRNA (uracil-O(2)-)-methyltransferase [Orussus abietinus]
MDFMGIVNCASSATATQFWGAMNIWLTSPHVVNRRILTSIRVLSAEMKDLSSHHPIWGEKLECMCQIVRSIKGESSLALLEMLGDDFINLSEDVSLSDTSDDRFFIYVNWLLPRNVDRYSDTLELVVVDKSDNCFTCFHRSLDSGRESVGAKWPFRVRYKDNVVSLTVGAPEEALSHPSVIWLKEQLLPKILKWAENEKVSEGLVSGSLHQISPERYVLLYTELKRKYGPELVKSWSENTDPKKFVYEDIAIATYLLLLWEKERSEKKLERLQSFLDLGCGNGLLVYILSSEGHPGSGIDLRKRKIWDTYPKNVRLEIRSIVPSSSNLFPETDWLIGNHSDELTPWIPVIAARSSYDCRFFLLPCCAFEFDGKKYQRMDSSKSQYSEYLSYVKSICQDCGFRTEVDRLRIPSTKRICFVGYERIYPKEHSEAQDEMIRSLISKRSKGLITCSEAPRTPKWSSDFKPRESVEKVKNCTQLERSLIGSIVNLVANHLLGKVRLISPASRPDSKWNAGGQMKLESIASVIPGELLKQLKNECGGLQTLLKNNGHIFHVSGGTVHLKIPGADYAKRKSPSKTPKVSKGSIKRAKPCWFFENHPDGCPLSDDQCNFLHPSINTA